MARFTDGDRETLIQQVMKPIHSLRWKLEYPLNLEGMTKEDALQRLSECMEPDFFTAMQIGRKYARWTNGETMRIYIPEDMNSGDDDGILGHGITRDSYNRRVRRDWIVLYHLPRDQWPEGGDLKFVVDLSQPLGRAVKDWWLQWMAMENVINKIAGFVRKTFEQDLNTPGQVARAWPTVAPYLPEHMAQAVRNQKRRSSCRRTSSATLITSDRKPPRSRSS